MVSSDAFWVDMPSLFLLQLWIPNHMLWVQGVSALLVNPCKYQGKRRLFLPQSPNHGSNWSTNLLPKKIQTSRLCYSRQQTSRIQDSCGCKRTAPAGSEGKAHRSDQAFDGGGGQAAGAAH
eukprot:4887710-Amphidinium_carterae.2